MTEPIQDRNARYYVDRVIAQVLGPVVIDVEYPTSTGSPDAVLTLLDGGTLAMELTQVYHAEPTSKGDRWERVRPRIRELQDAFVRHASNCLTRLRADIRLKGPALPNGRYLDQLAEELVADCRHHQQVENEVELYDFDLGGTLARYIAELHVLPRLMTRDNEIEEARRHDDLQVLDLEQTFGWLADDDIVAGLTHAIQSKQAKLPNYRLRAPEVWLLLHGGIAPSSWPPTPKHLRSVAVSLNELLRSSGFERVIYDTAFDPPFVLWP